MAAYSLQGKRVWVAGHRGMVGSAIVRRLASENCEVLTVEPNRSLSYSWDFAHDDPACALKSVVTFTLTPSPRGTHLRMEQVGFRPEQKQAFGGAKAGWQQFFAKLEEVAGRAD